MGERASLAVEPHLMAGAAQIDGGVQRVAPVKQQHLAGDNPGVGVALESRRDLLGHRGHGREVEPDVLVGGGVVGVAGVLVVAVFVTLLVIGILATLLGSKYFSSHPVRWLIPVLLALVALVSGVVLKLRVFRSFSVVSEIYAYMDEVAFRKKEILTAFLYSLATQTIMICNVYILARGLSMHAPFVSVLCFVPVVSIISLIPVTISGIGLREGAFVVLFGLIGIVPDKAMTLSIIWFISIVAGSLPGLIIYLLHHKTLLKAFPEQA